MIFGGIVILDNRKNPEFRKSVSGNLIFEDYFPDNPDLLKKLDFGTLLIFHMYFTRMSHTFHKHLTSIYTHFTSIYKYFTCILHVFHMYFTYISHAFHMHFTCILQAFTCILHAFYMHFTSILHVFTNISQAFYKHFTCD